MKPASKFFKTLFPSVEDAGAFLFAKPGESYKRNDIVIQNGSPVLVTGGLERYQFTISNKVTPELQLLHSYPVAPGDSRLLPAVVLHYFYNSRHRLATKPYYFWLHWFKNGKEIAFMKVEPNADGTFPVVGYCSKKKKLVMGTAEKVWTALPGYQTPVEL